MKGVHRSPCLCSRCLCHMQAGRSRLCCGLAGFFQCEFVPALPTAATARQLQHLSSVASTCTGAHGLRGCGDQVTIQDLIRLLLLQITQPLIWTYAGRQHVTREGAHLSGLSSCGCTPSASCAGLLGAGTSAATSTPVAGDSRPSSVRASAAAEGPACAAAHRRKRSTPSNAQQPALCCQPAADPMPELQKAQVHSRALRDCCFCPYPRSTGHPPRKPST